MPRAVNLTAAAALLVLLCNADPAAAAAKLNPVKKSTVCPRTSYEVQYGVRQNSYVNHFANVVVSEVQRDVTRELRERKIIHLCSPVNYHLLKGCFHALRKNGRRVTLGVFQFAYKVHYKCRSGKDKYLRIQSWATTDHNGLVLRGKANIKSIPAKLF